MSLLRISFKYLSLSLLVILVFCSRENKNSSEEIAEMGFEVDSTKLELTSYNQDLGIQFNAPREWKPIHRSLFEEFSKQSSTIFLEGNDFNVSPIFIFLNQQNNSFLYISQFQNLEDSTGLKKYKDLIQGILSPTKVGDFLKDNIIFTQYLIQDEKRINFKLLFFNSQNQLIQFDYIVPNDCYLSELKAIESSIGSIRLLDATQTILFEGFCTRKRLI